MVPCGQKRLLSRRNSPERELHEGAETILLCAILLGVDALCNAVFSFIRPNSSGCAFILLGPRVSLSTRESADIARAWPECRLPPQLESLR